MSITIQMHEEERVQKCLQPFFLGTCPVLNLVPGIHPAEDCGNSNYDNIKKLVSLVVWGSRIRNLLHTSNPCMFHFCRNHDFLSRSYRNHCTRLCEDCQLLNIIYQFFSAAHRHKIMRLPCPQSFQPAPNPPS